MGATMTAAPRFTFLLDVDNTLLDNDAAKRAIDAGLRDLLGAHGTARFWTLYEEVRRDIGVVSYPLTLARFREEGGRRERGAGAGGPAGAGRFALADLLMDFPYERFVFPGALATIAHLRDLGRVAILSDGDPTYQPGKIARSGLGAAVDGHVLVYAHKEEHLREVTAVFPADHYVLVEDKPAVIAKVYARLDAPLTTVLVRQGKYAAAASDPAIWPGPDLTFDAIGDLRACTLDRFRAARGRALAARRGGGSA